MKAALISLGSKSSKMTVEAMEKYFDSVDMLNIKEMEVTFGGADKKAQILHQGKPLPDFDCVYVKGSFNYGSISRAITTFYEGRAYLPFSHNAFTTVHDKLLSHICFEKNDIPQPLTYLSSTSIAAKQILKRVPYPIILKFPQGTHGKGVMVADSYAAASSVLDALESLNQPFLIQEFIETAGSDIRAFVVGDKVVAAMKRLSSGDEKRANIHQGGTAESYNLPPNMKRVAVATAQALKMDIAGVDILEGPKGPLVIEANISPGLQGITKATGIDIADHIAKFLYNKTVEFKEGKKAEAPSATDLLDELSGSDEDILVSREIITNLDFRANRILLPEIATKVAKFSESDEVVIELGQKSIKLKKS